MGMRYSEVVDYAGGLDHFKKEAAAAARTTERALRHHNGFSELPKSRGGSIYLIRREQARIISTFGLVLETLGTKSKVADEMYRLTGVPYFGNNAKDAVAMVVNDAATGGVAPLVLNMLLEVGSSDWFKDELRYTDLIAGWRDACIKARCVWGGGETPALSGVIYPDTFSLSGAAMGVSLAPDPEAFSDGSLIKPGDAIILLLHNGIGANGLSLARKIADRRDPLWRRFLAALVGVKHTPLRQLPQGLSHSHAQREDLRRSLTRPYTAV
jgi:phosphoribosylformylglycinamidine cyclo-ligase